jgi:hypothetical protein
MKTYTRIILSTVAITGIMTMTGCGKKPQEAGVGERTGAALDEAAKKSAAKAEDITEKVKDGTGRAVEKAGEVLDKAGEAVEKAGSDLQK